MYGVSGNKTHEEFAKDVLLYAKELCEQKKIDLELLGALVIICNKIIPIETLDIIWRQIAMLKAFEYAEKKGKIEERREIAREMLRKNMEISLIREVTKLSADEVQKLQQEMEQK